MGITYAGYDLLAESPDDVIAEWISQHAIFEDLCAYKAGPTAIAGHQTDAIGPVPVGLPRPNWTKPPSSRVNTLYWPTGASRWAFGVFLADSQTKDRLKSTVGTGSATLDLDDFLHRPVAPAMFMLPPRPVSPEITNTLALWMIPLVDARWFWQFVDVGDLSGLDDTAEWSPDIFGPIETALGITMTRDDVAVDYHQPDYVSWGRSYGNVAVLLDAAAFCVGQRITRDLSGQVFSSGWTAAELVLEDNLSGGLVEEQAWHLIAGGDMSDCLDVVTPEKVKSIFPKYYQHAPAYDGDVEEIIRQEGRPSSFHAGMNKVIHNTMPADFSAGSASADNATELESLGDIIATDYYQSISKCFDYTYLGLRDWDPTNWDDWMIFSMAKRVPDTEDEEFSAVFDNPDVPRGWLPHVRYICTTRIISMPHNYGVDEMLHADGHEVIFGATMVAKSRAGGIAAYSGAGDFETGTVDVYSVDATGTPTDRAFTAEAYNNAGIVAGNEWLQLKRVENTWMVDVEKCDGT